ncbi:MAG: hypothetical protein ACREDR_08845 [Blastocatellia bacterium]
MNTRLLGVTALCVVLGMAVAACRTPREADGPAAAGSTEGEPVSVEDSGKTLNGTYALTSWQDDYSGRNPAQTTNLRWSFGEDGRFQRQETAPGRGLRSSEGTYVIGTHDELVLYIEKVDSQPLDSARVERYVIETTGADGLKLRYESAGIITLQKQ